jgi:hypothetical protein
MDQTRDVSGRQLYRINQLYKPPQFVKSASVDDLCGHDDLPLQVFGDPRHRLFPCHTAAATWTSMAFFTEKKAEFRRDDAQLIEGRILHCAKVHGIERQVKALSEKIAKTVAGTEAELHDDDFAIVVGDERHYPMRNSIEVTKAAAYLVKWRDKMTYDLRQQMADKILQKSAQHGVSLGEMSDIIEKQAGHGACSAREASELIVNRVYASRKNAGDYSDAQTRMLKLAEEIVKFPSKIREPGMLCKLAATVDCFDRFTGLTNQYGPEFPRAEDVLFGLTGEKMASVIRDHCSTTSGNIYKLADLERVKIADVRERMGDDFANAVTTDGLRIDSEKAAAIVPTLDRGYADLFDRLLADTGIMPMAKEASAEAIKISHGFLKELAQRGAHQHPDVHAR